MEAIAREIAADIDAQRGRMEESGMPRVTLTYAQSVDGSIAAQRGAPTVLSGAASMRMTHMLRTMHDGILVGIGTILADNPSLNARLAEGRNPRPIIVDTHLRCPTGIKLFMLPTCVKPIILCKGITASMEAIKKTLEDAGAQILACSVTCDDAGQEHVDLRDGLQKLHALGIQSIMIEGGAAIITACLREHAREHLIDRVVITIAPCFIGGVHAVQAPSLSPHSYPRLLHPRYIQLEDDLVVLGHL